MNILCNVLMMELEKYQPRYTGTTSELNFNQVVIEGMPEKSLPGNLLIAHRSYVAGLSSIEASCLICIDDTNTPLPTPLSIPIIFVQKDSDIAALSATIHNTIIFSHANDGLKTHLLTMLAQDATLDQMLRAATKKLGNPFTVFSSTYRLLGHSLIEHLAADTAKEAIHTGYINEDLLLQLKKNGDLGKIQRSGKVEHTTLPNGVEKLSLAVRSKGTYLGLISMYNYIRPFNSFDYDIVEFLGNLIRIHITKSTRQVSFEGDKYSALLTDLLEYPAEVDIINAKCRDLELTFGSHLQVILISPSKHDIISKNIPLALVERHWTQLVPNAHSFIYQDKLVCVFDAGSFRPLDSDLRTRIESFLCDNDLYAGVSNLFFDIAHFKIHYEQAEHVLRRADKQTRLVFFYDYIWEYVLDICQQRVSLRHLSHPIIHALANYDAQYGTEYLHTLETLLDCNGKLTDCAKALNVHYNTVKYRLKNIQQIIGADINDLHVMAQLLLAFKIYRELNQ